MKVLKCVRCGKKLLTYDNTSFRKYKSPLMKCKKCGARYADPRCHEIAIEGIPPDTFSIKSYVVLLLLGGFLLYRGIHLSGMVQLNTPAETQWLMPSALTIGGLICIVGAVIEIITIKTGKKQKKFDRLRMESEQRLQDKQYVYILQDLGYTVPEKYL